MKSYYHDINCSNHFKTHLRKQGMYNPLPFFQFSQNEELKQQLLWTHPKTLVEASPYDQIWGIGLSEDDPKAWNKLTWRGKNLLGEILTTVRERLRRDIENAGPYGDSNDLDL